MPTFDKTKLEALKSAVLKLLKFTVYFAIAMVIIKLTMCQDVEGRVWRVQMSNGVIFDVPFRYLSFPYPAKIDQQKQNTLLLAADIVNFQPIRDRRKFNPDEISFMLSETPREFPFEELVRIAKDELHLQSIEGPEEYGLQRMLPVPGVRSTDRDDLWFEKQNGKEVMILHCTVVTLPFNHYCQMDFMYKDLRLNAFFQRRYITDWKRIKENSIRLLDGFAYKPYNKVVTK